MPRQEERGSRAKAAVLRQEGLLDEKAVAWAARRSRAVTDGLMAMVRGGNEEMMGRESVLRKVESGFVSVE